jgi:hypothetical protein
MKLKTVLGGKKLIYIFLSILIIIFHLKFRLLADIYIYIFCFVIILAAISWIVNEFWKSKLDKLFIDYPGRINSYKNFKRNYDIACVGGTQGLFAVDFTQQNDVSAFNWCMENQSLENDFLMLKNFFSILKKDGKVLLFLSPFANTNSELMVNKNYKYQIFLDKFLFTVNNNKKFYFRDWLVTNTLLRKKKDNLFLMSIHYYPILYPITIIKLFIEIKKRNNDLRTAETINDKKLKIDTEKRVKEFMNINSTFAIEKNKILLMEMNKFIKDRDLNLIIVIPPISSTLTNALKNTELNQKLKTFIHSAGILENSVLNYFNNKEFTNNSLFIDSYRLNLQGRKQFTTQLIKDIKNI